MEPRGRLPFEANAEKTQIYKQDCSAEKREREEMHHLHNRHSIRGVLHGAPHGCVPKPLKDRKSCHHHAFMTDAI
jgi:hypothetical protein